MLLHPLHTCSDKYSRIRCDPLCTDTFILGGKKMGIKGTITIVIIITPYFTLCWDYQPSMN